MKLSILALLVLGVLSVQEQEISFVLIGDYGDIRDPYEAEKTFDAINEFAAENEFGFFVTLGDNVYYHGITSVDDEKFQQMYKLFDRDNIKDKDVFGTLGNHDCEGSSQAMVDVSKKSDNNWIMDDIYYSRVWDLDNNEENGKELGVLFLNGCLLCCYSSDPEPQCVQFYVPDDQQIEKHYTWIKNELKRMKEQEGVIWTAMAIHYPIWSTADDHLDTKLLQTKLFGTLAEYRVDFFFAGHTHTMQYANWPYNKELKYRDPVTDISTCSKDKEINVDDTHDVTFKQGDYLHHFIIGSTGKHELEMVCSDYEKRTTGDLKYATNTHWTFANVKVTSDAFTVTTYARIDNDDTKHYEEIYKVTVEK